MRTLAWVDKRRLEVIMKRKIFFKVVLFMMILLVVLQGVIKVTTTPGDSRRNYQWIRGFYDEPDNSLDGVFIGSSLAYSSWIAPLAWERYGITVWPYTSSRQPFIIAKDMIEEARKTQPNAVYMVSVSTGGPDTVTEAAIHDTIDFMPVSLQKYRIINKLCDFGNYSVSDRLEYYVPLFRYHTRWSELKKTDFELGNNGLKGGYTYEVFLRSIVDVSAKVKTTEQQEELPTYIKDALEELFEYCESEQVKIVFVISPIAHGNVDKLAQLNMFKRMCEERGFSVIDEREVMSEIGIDPKFDYYDERHTNIHGAIKYTDYVSRYLIEHYDIQDKRGTSGYESWDKAYERYREIADSHTLGFEWNGGLRDITLSAPQLSEINASGTSLTISWKSVSGAEGYRIYRKQITDDEYPPGWQFVTEVGNNTLEYEDAGLETDSVYCYTVVAFRKENDNYYFGRLSYRGITGITLMSAPEKLEFFGSVNLSWKEVEGADGYEVTRRILSDLYDDSEEGYSVNMKIDAGANSFYVDDERMSDLPYGYRVRAYRYDTAGEKVYGSYSNEVVQIPERSGPDVNVELIDGIPTLSWEKMEGITGYWIDRKEGNGEWESMAADPLSPDNTIFQDVTVKEGKQYIYRIRAYLEYGGESYYYSGQTAKIIAKKDGIELSAPEILLCDQEGNKIFLVWQPMETATHYLVYRYRWDEETETWGEKYMEKLTDPACQQSPEKSGRYFYVVRALYDNGAYMNLGDYDKGKGCVVDYRKINNAD